MVARGPTPDVNTKRYFVDYEGLHGKHTVLFRFGANAVDADCRTKIADFINAAKPLIPTTTTFTGLRIAAPGSAFSFPATWTAVTGTNATALTGDKFPVFYSWVGRDTAGYRARISLLGIPATLDTTYRMTAAESPTAAAVLAVLNSALPTPIHSVAGFVVLWNQYTNLGVHSYFQRKRRRG